MKNHYTVGSKPTETELRAAILAKKDSIDFRITVVHPLRDLMGESSINDVLSDYIFGEDGSRSVFISTHLGNYEIHGFKEQNVEVTYSVRAIPRC